MSLEDGLSKNEPKTQELYSISFQSPPTQIEEYKIGDRVTRNNFMSFFIKSFAVSMGQIKVQILFMEWVKIKYGFDYKLTLSDLKTADGWNAFSNEEKQQFRTYYYKVSRHKTEIDLDDRIDDEIYSIFFDTKNVDICQAYGEDIIQILSNQNYNEFMSFANREVKRLRELKK